MKKLASGFYEGEYRNIVFTVSKINRGKTILWHWCIEEKRVHDFSMTRKSAVLEVESFIEKALSTEENNEGNTSKNRGTQRSPFGIGS